jgi:hypothetical protein
MYDQTNWGTFAPVPPLNAITGKDIMANTVYHLGLTAYYML